MIKCSKFVKKLSFMLAIILGIFFGYKTYDAPISSTLMMYRVITVISSILLVIISIMGLYFLKKYDINSEILIDVDDEDYFIENQSKFKSNIFISILVGILLLTISFIGEFHAPVMLYVASIFFFSILFIYIFPIIDELMLIIAMGIEYRQSSIGDNY